MKGFNWFMMHANDLYNVSNVLWVARALKSPEYFYSGAVLFSLDIFCSTVMPLYGNEATIINVKYDPPFVVFSCLKYLHFCFPFGL